MGWKRSSSSPRSEAWSKVVGEPEVGVRAGEHVGVEAPDAIAARLLRGVHRQVGVPEQLLALDARLDRRQPDAPAQGERAPPDVHRCRQRAAHALGDGHALGDAAEVVEQEGELVPAEPRGGVAGAQAGLEPPGDGDEHGVPGVVAERVVDELEPVEVDQRHDELAGPVATLQRL